MAETKRPIDPIDPKAFTAKLPNIDKLKIAMQEAPQLFESIKKGTIELSDLIVKFKTLADQFDSTRTQIADFYKKLTGGPS